MENRRETSSLITASKFQDQDSINRKWTQKRHHPNGAWALQNAHNHLQGQPLRFLDQASTRCHRKSLKDHTTTSAEKFRKSPTHLITYRDQANTKSDLVTLKFNFPWHINSVVLSSIKVKCQDQALTKKKVHSNRQPLASVKAKETPTSAVRLSFLVQVRMLQKRLTQLAVQVRLRSTVSEVQKGKKWRRGTILSQALGLTNRRQ